MFRSATTTHRTHRPRFAATAVLATVLATLFTMLVAAPSNAASRLVVRSSVSAPVEVASGQRFALRVNLAASRKLPRGRLYIREGSRVLGSTAVRRGKRHSIRVSVAPLSVGRHVLSGVFVGRNNRARVTTPARAVYAYDRCQRTPAWCPSAPGGDYPSASTTGVPAGVALRASGAMTISTPGTVIDGRDINGAVQVNASNVTIKNSRIRSNNWAVIRVADSARNVVVQDSEIDGLGFSGGTGSTGIIGPVTALRNDIHGLENGVTPGTGSVLRDNWIHDFAAPGAPHYDGIQIDGNVGNMLIDHNTVQLNRTQTSAVMIDNYFGPVNDVTVNNNWLSGGCFTVYSDGQFNGGALTNIRFTNNRLAMGYYGFKNFVKNSPVWSGNVNTATSQGLS